MEIKNINQFPQINDAKRKQENTPVPANSFLSMMQNRINTEQVRTAVSESENDNLSIDTSDIFGLSGIEAVSARSRVQYANGGDVSDFLELIGKKDFLLKGASFEDLSDGAVTSKSLTAEQAQALAGKYNINDLSPQEQYSLFRELVVMGILSKPDAQNAQQTVSPDGGDLMGYLTSEPAFRDITAIPDTDLKSRLEAMTGNERFAYDHVKDRYGKQCESVSRLADSHQRTLDILNQIGGA